MSAPAIGAMRNRVAVVATAVLGLAVAAWADPATLNVTTLHQRPASVAVDPSGKFLYVANQASNDVSAFTIDQFSGVLKAITGSPFVVGMNPTSVSVDVSGKFVYVTNSASNNVSTFSLDPTTGALTPVSGSPFPAGSKPSSVTTTGKIQ